MSNPLDEHALDFLDADVKRVIKDMLKAVVEHANVYNNGSRSNAYGMRASGTFLVPPGTPAHSLTTRSFPSMLAAYWCTMGSRANGGWDEFGGQPLTGHLLAARVRFS